MTARHAMMEFKTCFERGLNKRVCLWQHVKRLLLFKIWAWTGISGAKIKRVLSSSKSRFNTGTCAKMHARSYFTLPLSHPPSTCPAHTITPGMQGRGHADGVAIERNSGVFVLSGAMKQVQETACPWIPFISCTSGVSIAPADAHSSAATRLTHSAQQQQHAAHHNGHHDGQFTAPELHFGNDVTKVPHLDLGRQEEWTRFLINE